MQIRQEAKLNCMNALGYRARMCNRDNIEGEMDCAVALTYEIELDKCILK